MVERLWTSRETPTVCRPRGKAWAWCVPAVIGLALGVGACSNPATAVATEVGSAGAPAATSAARIGAPMEAPTPRSYDPAGYDPEPGRGFVPLDDPAFVPADPAGLDPDEFVLGVEWNGEARAYPVAMMAYHHIANDQVRGSPILITY